MAVGTSGDTFSLTAWQRHGPALTSRHTEGNADDMSTCLDKDLTIDQADGTSSKITCLPRDGADTDLAATETDIHIPHHTTHLT